ncbi:hypothetical protein PPM_4653 [Paenibacillus polymyxa M1]|nr:hypothetical protein PPM_4653 [Paenibacillus polymyxa M1]
MKRSTSLESGSFLYSIPLRLIPYGKIKLFVSISDILFIAWLKE